MKKDWPWKNERRNNNQQHFNNAGQQQQQQQQLPPPPPPQYSFRVDAFGNPVGPPVNPAAAAYANLPAAPRPPMFPATIPSRHQAAQPTQEIRSFFYQNGTWTPSS